MLEGVHGNAMALRLDSKVLARYVEHRLQTLIERRLDEAGRAPGLAVLRTALSQAKCSHSLRRSSHLFS